MIPEQFDYEYFWLPCVFEVYAIRTLYINPVFRLVDKRGILYQFFVFFPRFSPIAVVFVIWNSVLRGICLTTVLEIPFLK
jgi:hypothetical protein